jgi:hypothetical protein
MRPEKTEKHWNFFSKSLKPLKIIEIFSSFLMRTLKVLLHGCENRNRWFSQKSENRPTWLETVRRGRPKWNYAKLNQCFSFGGKILQQSWL